MQLYLRMLPVLLLMQVLLGCADAGLEPTSSQDRSDGVDAIFNQNFIMEDDYFRARNAITGDGLQLFLKQSPYNNTSWLAKERIDGQRAADIIVQYARDYRINPLVLLARMQTESSLVAKSKRPSQKMIDQAFGCGCWDKQSCNQSLAGFSMQAGKVCGSSP